MVRRMVFMRSLHLLPSQNCHLCSCHKSSTNRNVRFATPTLSVPTPCSTTGCGRKAGSTPEPTPKAGGASPAAEKNLGRCVVCRKKEKGPQRHAMRAGAEIG